MQYKYMMCSTVVSRKYAPPPPPCIFSAKSCSGMFIPLLVSDDLPSLEMDTAEERESSDGEENGEDEEAEVDELDPFSEDSDSDPE